VSGWTQQMAERFLEQVRVELVNGTVFLELDTRDLRSLDLVQRYSSTTTPVVDPDGYWESGPDAAFWSPDIHEGPAWSADPS